MNQKTTSIHLIEIQIGIKIIILIIIIIIIKKIGLTIIIIIIITIIINGIQVDFKVPKSHLKTQHKTIKNIKK